MALSHGRIKKRFSRPGGHEKLPNRMQFSVLEESSLVNGLREGYGILSLARNGKLHAPVGQEN